jgi:hypothetical protein
MKKLTTLILAFSLGLSGFAQKKSGIVYSEHEYIDKTKEFWKAFVNNDKQGFKNLLADSVYNYNNGTMTVLTKEQLAGNLSWWAQIDNLEVKDNPPANPDAIEYDGGVTWVQDWLIVNGTHNASGINLEMPFHMLYRFNKEGKIFVLMWNYNNDVFEEINGSASTTENGTIYINHPFINTLRKYMNDYAAGDAEKCAEYFAPNAYFKNATMKMDEYRRLSEQIEIWKKSFAAMKSMKLKVIGYPDLLHYTKGDSYKIISWWKVTLIDEKDQKIEFPLLLDHNFNKEGKITSENAFYSSNHFE